MEGLRLFQQQALRQLFRSQSLRRSPNFQQIGKQTQAAFRTRSIQWSQTRKFHQSLRSTPLSRPLNRPHRTQRRFNSTASTSEEQLSLSQRMKKLSREYGWSALGVYLALSAADFPFCFLTVRLVGADTIGHYEHIVMSSVKAWIKWPLGSDAQDTVEDAADTVKENMPSDLRSRILEEESQSQIPKYEYEDHGYKEAEQANSGSNASIWTQLALAYAIHKSFIFIRVPLTAAVTPKVVKTLRGWGWNIGKMPKRTKAKTGVNTKGSRVKPDDD